MEALDADGPDLPGVLAQLAADIESSREHFGSQRMDLGFAYASGALATGRRSARASRVARARWRAHLDARPVRPRFALLAAGDSSPWRTEVSDTGVPIALAGIGPGQPLADPTGSFAERYALRARRRGASFAPTDTWPHAGAAARRARESAREVARRVLRGGDVSECAAMVEAVFSDEMIAEMRAKVGSEMRIEHSVWNEEATRLAILKFAAGIGDANPLWCEPGYGARTRYGSQVAPPSFAIGCFSGLAVRLARPRLVPLGQRLPLPPPRAARRHRDGRCTFDGFDGPKPSRFAPRIAINHFTNRYANQRGETVAEIHWSVIHFERGAGQGAPRRAGGGARGPAALERSRSRRTRPRGPRPGAARPRSALVRGRGARVILLETLTKGPIGLTDEIAFVAGGGAPIPRLCRASERVARLREARGLGVPRPDHVGARADLLGPLQPKRGERDGPARALRRRASSASAGSCSSSRNWIGGRQAGCGARARSTGSSSTTATWSGSAGAVLRRYVGRRRRGAASTCATHAVNQRGDDVMPGEATVALPSRERGSSPVARRMEET